MSTLQKLSSTNSLHDLASLLGVKPTALSFVLYKLPPSIRYTTFHIPKAGGGLRTIKAPEPRLKLIQRRLAETLGECHEEILKKRGVDINCRFSHGFTKGLSIHTNAATHLGRKQVFNLDLSDFFGSINFGRVRGFFLKNADFSLAPKIATLVAQIACDDNALPQGAPTSPIISNLLANILDLHLGRLAQTANCTYTRYADDITFSTSESRIPSNIANVGASAPHAWEAGDAVRSRIFRAGFSINPSKTRLQYRHSRQDVTGLVVNKKINVKAEYYKTTRAMCHRLFMDGFFFRKPDAVPLENDSLRGRLSFVFYTRTRSDGVSAVRDDNKKPGYHLLYKRFLDYTTFYERDRPIIVGEGKTDHVYLSCAIRSLTGQFPALGNPSAAGFVRLVDFFRYSDTAKNVQDLGGGAGDLAYLIHNYQQRTKNFLAPVKRHPVILVVDHDEAGKKVFAAASKLANTKIDGSQRYYHLYHNLYLVPVPLLPNATSNQIEDLFDAKTLSELVDGKTFSPDETADKTKHYGKHIFAEKVVRPNCLTISFDGFKPLLGGIEKAIEHYNTISI